jgi:anti-sigma regulatory factor (Ser/Thr protein kinase)
VLLRFPARRTATAEPRAVPELRHFAVGTAGDWGLGGPALEALGVIVSELVTNAVLHSGSPDVTVWLGTRERALTVRVADSGRWKHRLSARDAQDAQDEEALRGRGLSLVRAYATRITTDTDGGGTVMTAEISLRADRSAHWNQP